MDVVQRLSQMRLFDVMSDEDRARWAARFRREQYPRGETVIRQGDRATAFYVVDEGELRACIRAAGKESPRAYFYPGDYFGETGLLTGEPRNATIDVLTDAELFVLDKLYFDQVLGDFPEIREELRALGSQREEAGRTRFPWQQPDEVTVFFSTKHWVALARALRLTLLSGILSLVTTAVYTGAELADLPAAILMVAAGTLLALTVFSFVYHVFDWRNDHYVITNVRVLHVERVLLLRESRDEAPIGRVQDVQVKQEGLLANVLNFGDVFIQTAAATERIVFADVSHPAYVRDALFAPVQYAHTRERAEVRESIRQELGQRLNIPVPSLEDQDGLEKGQEPLSPAGEEVEAREEGALGSLGWLLLGWRWLQERFAFDTWIVSDGGETITWRKNGWLLFRVSVPPASAALLFAALFLWVVSRGVGFPLFPLFLLLLLLSSSGWWFYIYWDWQNDIYQVSGNRLIDLKKRPLFLEEFRRETTLDRVENIGLSIPGPIARLLNYGTVVIETAGETGGFEFRSVHDPRGVQAEIFNRRERHQRQQSEAEMLRRHSEMAEWFEIYEELKRSKE